MNSANVIIEGADSNLTLVVFMQCVEEGWQTPVRIGS
jgi:hypothetical protein